MHADICNFLRLKKSFIRQCCVGFVRVELIYVYYVMTLFDSALAAFDK